MIELDVIRAFPKAQELLDSGGRSLTRLTRIGWHGTSVEETEGATAVVPAGQEDLVGETLRVSYKNRSVLVYVMGTRDVPVEVSLSRRAFLALSVLSAEELRGTVEVLR